MTTAEQKIRQQLTGDPYGEPYFQHEGFRVIRRITGGTAPDAYVTLQPRESEIVAYCPHCEQELGRFDATNSATAYRQIGKIREEAIRHSSEKRHM